MCELGGTKEAGDPERLFGAFQRLIVGREVRLGERELQVARAVSQTGVFLTLKKKNKNTHMICQLALQKFGHKMFKSMENLNAKT